MRPHLQIALPLQPLPSPAMLCPPQQTSYSRFPGTGLADFASAGTWTPAAPPTSPHGIFPCCAWALLLLYLLRRPHLPLHPAFLISGKRRVKELTAPLFALQPVSPTPHKPRLQISLVLNPAFFPSLRMKNVKLLLLYFSNVSPTQTFGQRP